MSKQNLFRLIRQEDVILFVGAGFSLYAGYPSGKQLKEVFLNELNDDEKSEIDQTSKLPELTNDIHKLYDYEMGGLISILKKQFVDRVPSSTKFHDKLAQIPHFKTIITTNYDCMIEDAYGKDCGVAFNAKQITSLPKSKTNIYKIHGDLKDSDSIILTESQYRNFFKNNSENDSYWVMIKSLLISHHILFIGYSLEDPNIAIIFDKISEALGNDRKNCYLIAPNLNRLKRIDLEKKNINYIDSIGEVFLDELYSNINDNIIRDLEQNIVSVETCTTFCGKNKVQLGYSTKGADHRINSFKSIESNHWGKADFTIVSNTPKANEFLNFMDSQLSGGITIDRSDLKDFDLRCMGIRMLDLENLSKITIMNKPSHEVNVDIIFDDNFEIVDIPVKIFKKNSLLEMQIELSCADIIINLDINNERPKFTYTHKKKCSRVKEEIMLFTLLEKIGLGETFKIITSEGKEFENIHLLSPEILSHIGFFKEYFKNLKYIEEQSKVRFTNFDIDSVTDNTFDQARNLVRCLKGQKIKLKDSSSLGIKLNGLTSEKRKSFEALDGSEVPMIIGFSEYEEFELHSQKIGLGYKMIEFEEPYISNIENVKGDSSISAKLESKSNKVSMFYSKKLDNAGS